MINIKTKKQAADLLEEVKKTPFASASTKRALTLAIKKLRSNTHTMAKTLRMEYGPTLAAKLVKISPSYLQKIAEHNVLPSLAVRNQIRKAYHEYII